MNSVKLPDIQMKYRLPSQLAKLLLRLLEEKLVTADEITHDFGITAFPRVAIYRLSKVLKGEGVDIQRHNSVGYWLDDETKQRVINSVLNIPPDHGGAGPFPLTAEHGPVGDVSPVAQAGETPNAQRNLEK